MMATLSFTALAKVPAAGQYLSAGALTLQQGRSPQLSAAQQRLTSPVDVAPRMGAQERRLLTYLLYSQESSVELSACRCMTFSLSVRT